MAITLCGCCAKAAGGIGAVTPPVVVFAGVTFVLVTVAIVALGGSAEVKVKNLAGEVSINAGAGPRNH